MVGVKGWDMPDRCGDCCFCDWIMGHGGDWAYYCIVPNKISRIGKYIDIEKPRPDACPLVEIKDDENEQENNMKEYKLTLVMPDSFEPGECFNCPLAIRDDDAEHYCVMHYRYCDCPLREGQAIEEDYTD